MKDPVTPTDLDRLMIQIIDRQATENLPDFLAYLDGEPKAKQWILDQEGRMRQAVRDGDEVLFDEARRTWLKACVRVNENIAEAYRVSHQDPQEWDLRYLRWMTKVVYVQFDTPMGEFYLVPRRPRRRPKAEYWYTVDEMIAMLRPAVSAAIQMSGRLPPRPETLGPPRRGEKHLRLDFTSGKMVARYDCGEVIPNAGEDVR